MLTPSILLAIPKHSVSRDLFLSSFPPKPRIISSQPKTRQCVSPCLPRQQPLRLRSPVGGGFAESSPSRLPDWPHPSRVPWRLCWTGGPAAVASLRHRAHTLPAWQRPASRPRLTSRVSPPPSLLSGHVGLPVLHRLHPACRLGASAGLGSAGRRPFLLPARPTPGVSPPLKSPSRLSSALSYASASRPLLSLPCPLREHLLGSPLGHQDPTWLPPTVP